MSTAVDPILSIIVPVYNSEDYLEECLDSILNQTLRNIEVLVIDDGSTDSSSEIIRNYASVDIRVKPFFKENGGASDARNYGLVKATGKYITFVDSDDVLLNANLYEKTIKEFSVHPQVDAIQFNVLFKWNSPYENKRDIYCKEYLGIQSILWGYLNEQIHTSVVDKIFKAEIIKEIKFDKGEVCEDVAIIPKFVAGLNGIYVYDIGYYGYRYVEHSVSNSLPQPNKIYSILKSYKKYLSLCIDYDEFKTDALNIYTSLIWNYTTVMGKYHKEFLNEYYSQPIFIKIPFLKWLKHRPATLQDNIKSFLVCVAGVKNVYRFQSIFAL